MGIAGSPEKPLPLGFEVESAPPPSERDKRRRLVELRGVLTETLDEIDRLEMELGNHPCAACGRAHVGERCIEQHG